MKKILFGIILIGLVVSLGYCQDHPLQITTEADAEFILKCDYDEAVRNAQPLQLSIKADKEVYKVGDPIQVISRLTNISNKPVTIAKVSLWGEMSFLSRDNKEPVIITWDAWIPQDKDGYVTLSSDSYREWQGDISSNEVIKDKVGIWDLKFTHAYGFSRQVYQQAWEGTLISNTITIEVVEKEDTAKPTCPKCRLAKDVIPIVYGLPGSELMKRSERGEVNLGGCMPSASQWHCKKCAFEWE